MTQNELILSSLEKASESGGDPTPLIYERLFREFPEMEELFVLDRDGGVRGSMLQHTFECILDMAGERRMAPAFISAERMQHDGYGVPEDTFHAFFEIVRDTVRDLLSDEWTEDMERAWTSLIAEIAHVSS